MSGASIDVGTLQATIALTDSTSSTFDAIMSKVDDSFSALTASLSKITDSLSQLSDKLGAVAPKLKDPIDDGSASAAKLEAAFNRVAGSLDPTTAAANKLASAQTTLNAAVEAGIVDQTKYQSLMDSASAKYDTATSGANKLTSEVARITAAVDPAAAATAKLSTTQSTLGAALKAGVIDLEQHNSLLEKATEKYAASGSGAATFSKLVEGVTAVASSCGEAVAGMSDKLEGISSKFTAISSVVGDMTALLPVILSLAAAVAILAVGFEAFDYLKEIVQDGMKTQVVVEQLNATLKDSGYAAGYSAHELIEHAEALTLVSGQSKEAIVQGETILAKYTTIGHDTFPKATQAALDLGAKTGNLGKAFSDVGVMLAGGTKAFGALNDAGVRLNANQKLTLTTMQTSGQVAQYQAAVLKQLADQVDGAAAAYQGTLAGSIGTVTAQYAIFKEEIASEVIPALQDGLTALVKQAGGFKNLQDAAKSGGESVGYYVRAMVTGIGQSYEQLLLDTDTMQIQFTTAFKGVSDFLADTATFIITTTGKIASALHIKADTGPALAAISSLKGSLDKFSNDTIDKATNSILKETGAYAAMSRSMMDNKKALDGDTDSSDANAKKKEQIAQTNKALQSILDSVNKSITEYTTKNTEQVLSLSQVNTEQTALSKALGVGIEAYNAEVVAQGRVAAVTKDTTTARKAYESELLTLTSALQKLTDAHQQGSSVAVTVRADIDKLTTSYNLQKGTVADLAGANYDLTKSTAAKKVLADSDIAAADAQRTAVAKLTDATTNDTTASQALTVQLLIEKAARANVSSETGITTTQIAAKISAQQAELALDLQQTVAADQLNTFLKDYNSLIASTSDDTTKIALQREYGTSIANLAVQLGGASQATRALSIEEETHTVALAAGVAGNAIAVAAIRTRITAEIDATNAMKDGLALATASADVWKPLQDGFTNALTAGQNFLNTFIETGKLDFSTLGKSLEDAFLKSFESILANYIQLQAAMAAASATGSQISGTSSGSGIVAAIAGSAGQNTALQTAGATLTAAGASLEAAASALLALAGIQTTATSTGLAATVAGASSQLAAGTALTTSGGFLITSAGTASTALIGSGTALTFSATALDSSAVSLGAESTTSTGSSLLGARSGSGGLFSNIGGFLTGGGGAALLAAIPAAIILGFANSNSQTTVHPYTFGGYSIGTNTGPNGSVDTSGVGSAGSAGYSRQPGNTSDTQVTDALKSFFDTFDQTTNAFVTSLPQIGVRILQGGKQFEAEFAGQILGLYNSESDAINAAIVAGLHNASFTNLPGVISDYVKQATDSTSASYQSDPSAIMANVTTLQQISDQAGGALSQVTTDMRGFFSTADDFDTKIEAMGLNAADTATAVGEVNSGLLANIQSERDNLTGVTVSAKQKQALDIQAYNSQLQIAEAQLKMNNSQLQTQALALAGQGYYINGLGEVARATADTSTILSKSAAVMVNANQTQIDGINSLIDQNNKLIASLQGEAINPGDVKGPEGGGGNSNSGSNTTSQITSATQALQSSLESLAENGMDPMQKAVAQAIFQTNQQIIADKGNAAAIAILNQNLAAQLALINAQTTSSIWDSIKPLIEQANGLTSFQVNFQGVIDQFAQYYSDAQAAGDTTQQLGRITKAEKQAEYNLIMQTVQALNLPLDSTLASATQFSNAVQALNAGLADGSVSLSQFNSEMQQIAQLGAQDVLTMIEGIYTSVGNTKAAEKVKEQLQQIDFEIQLAQLQVMAASLLALGDITQDLYNNVEQIENYYANPANQPNWAAINAAANASASTVTDASSSIADALATLATSFETAKQSIQKTLDGLLAGTSGGVPPDQAIAAAQAQWQAEMTSAQSGDLAALQAAPQDTSDYITALKAYSPELYDVDLPQIESELKSLTQLSTVHDSSTGLSYSEQMVIQQQTANSSLSSIGTTLNDSGTTLDQGFANLSSQAGAQVSTSDRMSTDLGTLVRLQTTLNSAIISQSRGSVGNKRPVVPTGSRGGM